ncbi:MAG: PH domain-containing protein [Clostridia bacterium]|nr:PH domain-containing protein [Clostridia bacterium]
MNDLTSEIFAPVLDKDETVIKIFKPNKTKFVMKSLLAIAFAAIIFALFVLFTVFLSSFDEEGEPVPAEAYIIAPLAVIALCAVAAAIVTVIASLHYKNVFYAYTNKRILIRSGLIGVDYKSLNLEMIGAVNVNVSVIDKLLRKNTGTITFGSMASPLINNGNAQAAGYKFADIVAPYETYKELKEVIENKRAEKEKTA